MDVRDAISLLSLTFVGKSSRLREVLQVRGYRPVARSGMKKSKPPLFRGRYFEPENNCHLCPLISAIFDGVRISRNSWQRAAD